LGGFNAYRRTRVKYRAPTDELRLCRFNYVGREKFSRKKALSAFAKMTQKQRSGPVRHQWQVATLWNIS